MKAQEFLGIAPIEFDKTVSAMTNKEKYKLFHECENLAVAYAERAAYVKSRYGIGCGDHGHKASVETVNRIRKAVRKAFGYNTSAPFNF